jgi:DNA repair exonuclease SbcCD ATPase subunit
MGWASYIEDIQKFREDVEHFRRRLKAARTSGRGRETDRTLKEVDPRIASYERVLDGIIASLDKQLAIATDPAIDLVQENAALKLQLDERLKEVARLREKLAEFERDIALQAQSFAADLARQKEIIRKERNKARRAEEAFERLASQNFEAAIEIYPPESAKT